MIERLSDLGLIMVESIFSSEFDSFCAEQGIIHEKMSPYSSQSNGMAEIKNRTLTNLVNAMLDTSGLSKVWWGRRY